MNQKTLGIALAVVVIVGAVGYFTFVKKSSPTPTPTPITTTTGTTPQKTPVKTQPAKSGWQAISWHDPENPILGFNFDVPDSWVEISKPSERNIEIIDCPSEYKNNCTNIPAPLVKSIMVGVSDQAYVPNNDPLPVGWTKTTVKIGGITADKIIKPGEITLTDIDFNRNSNSFHIILANGGSPEQQKKNEEIFDHLISTFVFTTAKAPQAPEGYNMFKDIEKWALTYQSSNTSALVCADGRKGSTTKNYVFQMSTQGDTSNQTTPGDIDTPYAKVITTLQNNSWVECGTPKNQQDPSNKGYDQVFIKNNKLIGVFTHYSMGTGNSLSIYIQY